MTSFMLAFVAASSRAALPEARAEVARASLSSARPRAALPDA